MTVEIGVLIAIGGFVVGYLGYQLNKQKEVKSDSQHDAKIQAQLDYIGKGVDDIRIDLKANERQLGNHNERIIRLEESQKTVNNRLNRIEGEQK